MFNKNEKVVIMCTQNFFIKLIKTYNYFNYYKFITFKNQHSFTEIIFNLSHRPYNDIKYIHYFNMYNNRF